MGHGRPGRGSGAAPTDRQHVRLFHGRGTGPPPGPASRPVTPVGAPFPCSWWMRLAGKQSLSFPSFPVSICAPCCPVPWSCCRGVEPGCFLGGLLRGSDQSETGHTAPVIPELRAWKCAGEGWRPARGQRAWGRGGQRVGGACSSGTVEQSSAKARPGRLG